MSELSFDLQFGATWSDQLETIRSKVTEDSGLVRADGVPYRVCRADPATFEVRLMPAYPVSSGEAIVLEFGIGDLYCRNVGPHGKVERYPSGIQDTHDFHGQPKTPRNVALLDGYIRDVPKNHDIEDRFAKQMLLVMVVAESLRFERMATDVLNIARAGSLVEGDDKPTLALNLGAWKQYYDYWGDASLAIWDKAPAALRTPFEPLDPNAKTPKWNGPKSTAKPSPQKIELDPRNRQEVLDAAKTLRVIKRPERR